MNTITVKIAGVAAEIQAEYRLSPSMYLDFRTDGGNFSLINEQTSVFNLFADDGADVRISDEQHVCYVPSFMSEMINIQQKQL